MRDFKSLVNIDKVRHQRKKDRLFLAFRHRGTTILTTGASTVSVNKHLIKTVIFMSKDEVPRK